MKKTILLITTVICFSLIGNTQTAKKGDYSFLKGQKELNIEFDYTNMKVGKYATEEAYIKEKVAEHNKKEAGKGEKWKESWEGSREKRYQPKYMELINKSLEGVGMVAKENSVAKYTLIVKSIFTEPGFNVGVVKQPAYVDFEMIFIETDTKKEVGRYILYKIPGSQAMGYDFDAGSRIAECYAKAGKMMGSYIAKALK